MDRSPKILVVETSSRLGGVALAQGGDLKHAAPFQVDRNHAVELLPTIDALCRRMNWSAADLQQIYISIGPGSFTGLRIAVTLARTLALSTGARIVAVPTLQVIAQNGLRVDPPPKYVAALLDAKRKQVYAAAFELRTGRYVQTVEPCVVDPVEFLGGLSQPMCILGEGIAYHQRALEQVPHDRLPEALWPPRIEIVHQLGFERARRGKFEKPRELGPVYLRRPEAEEVWDRKHQAPATENDPAP